VTGAEHDDPHVASVVRPAGAVVIADDQRPWTPQRSDRHVSSVGSASMSVAR
jgi:hypothetical protein